MRRLATLALAAIVLGSLSVPALSQDLTIWWVKGTNIEEDEALKAAVGTWESETGKKAEVSFFANNDVTTKVLASLKAGSPPDLTFSFDYDLAFSPTWAYDGDLVDMSDVLMPIRDEFQKSALDSVYLLNGTTGKRSHYAVPWVQMTPHIHYWKSILEDAGFTESDIPDQWVEFFHFWCDDVQPAAREAGHRVFGLGQGYSTVSNDPFFNIHIWLNAYGAQVVAPDGTLRINEPEQKERIVRAMEEYVRPMKNKCVPPDAANWTGGDDNVSFINRKHLVEMNPTLSVPAAIKKADPNVYLNEIRTRPWPKAPDGSSTPAMVSVKQVVSFTSSANIENAKSFLRVLLRPENIGPMLKGTLGRWMPVMPALLDDPFYTDPADPHIYAMYRQFTETENIPFPHAYSRHYAKVMAERIWGKMLGRIVLDGWTTERAYDELAERMTELFAE